MTYLPPKVIVLGIDGLEYTLVEKWSLEEIKQKSYCKLDLSEYKVIVTPPIWSSMLIGHIDEGLMEVFVNNAKLLGGTGQIEKVWWMKIGQYITSKLFPSKVNYWIWDHIVSPIFRKEDPFEKAANYVFEKNIPNAFQFYEKPWTNGIPGFKGYEYTALNKELLKRAIEGESTPFRKYMIDRYKKDKKLLLDVLDKQNNDLVFWYTNILDSLGHMDIGMPVKKLMKHYLEINELVGYVKKNFPSSIVYVISDHGMQQIDPKLPWGDHSRHAFFSSNTGETIKKPYQLYNLLKDNG